ncbi:hypothetical protein PGB90_001414 [Kerria lacca]
MVDVQDENKYLNNSDDEYFLIALSVVQIAVVVRIIANIYPNLSLFSPKKPPLYILL